MRPIDRFTETLGHGSLGQAEFSRPYAVQVALAILTAGLCLAVKTRPRGSAP